MFIHELLFISLIISLVLYLAFRLGAVPSRQQMGVSSSSSSTTLLALIFSWTLALFAFLYTMAISIACTTDRGAQKGVYVFATLLLIANAVFDSALVAEGVATVPARPTRACIVRSVGVAIVALTLAIYGMVRTCMWAQCRNTRSIIKGAYLNVRDPRMSRDTKVGIAEDVIRSLSLSPSKTRRILRL